MKSKVCVFLLTSLAALAAVPAAAAAPAPSPASTRKIVLDKTGSGYRWKLVEAPVAGVGDRQVLIHVRALALNRGDLEILETTQGPDLSGRVVGSDAAGDVLAVGKDVQGVRLGMRVSSTYFKNYVDGTPDREKLSGSLGASVDGVAAEYLVLDATSVVPVAAGLTYEEAAALPTAGLTGWMATVGQRTLGKEDIVLVQGTGGVSLFALQFAAAAGAYVIVTSSSDEKLAQARQGRPGPGSLRGQQRRLQAHERVHRGASPAPGDR